MAKILFVGLGSIGQRHLQNLKEINKNNEIFALDNSKSGIIIKDLKSLGEENLSKYYNIKMISSLEEARKIKPDITFITNPSSLHLETAITFAEMGSHIFIEKPLGENLKDVDKLKDILDKKGLISMVGFQTRFNPLINEVKKIIEQKKNKIISSSFEWNNFLPGYHPYENYSKSYASNKNGGGGVILTLIHEIDLIYYLFGSPEKVFAVGGQLSNLDINVEDTVMAILTYGLNNKRIPIYLNLSFAQTKETRHFKVQFTDQTLFVDLIKNNYELYDEKGILIKEYKEPIERNDLFIRELTYFLDCVEKKKNTFLSVAEGKKSLEIALKIKKSMEENKEGI